MAGRLAAIQGRLAETSADERRLRTLLVLAHEIVRRDLRACEAPQAPPEQPSPPPLARADAIADYPALVGHVHEVAASRLPAGASVLVVSRGDEALFAHGFRMGHFPQGPGGVYAGHHPADSDAAIAHLHECRTAGAEFLLLPATGFWWLDYYGGLLHHLISKGRVFHHDESCLIFDLRLWPQGGPKP
jgi:hypothetical protein